MSVTFQVEGLRGGPELNVANTNAYAILRFLLRVNLGEPYGDLDPEAVLAELATAQDRRQLAVRQSSVSKTRTVVSDAGVVELPAATWIEHGLTLERVDYYVDKLRVIATEAKKRGARVEYS